MALSLQPDPDMAWIYDPTHPEYNTERAADLRERRRRALQSCPRWMLDAASAEDARRETAKRKR